MLTQKHYILARSIPLQELLGMPGGLCSIGCFNDVQGWEVSENRRSERLGHCKIYASCTAVCVLLGASMTCRDGRSARIGDLKG